MKTIVLSGSYTDRLRPYNLYKIMARRFEIEDSMPDIKTESCSEFLKAPYGSVNTDHIHQYMEALERAYPEFVFEFDVKVEFR